MKKNNILLFFSLLRVLNSKFSVTTFIKIMEEYLENISICMCIFVFQMTLLQLQGDTVEIAVRCTYKIKSLHSSVSLVLRISRLQLPAQLLKRDRGTRDLYNNNQQMAVYDLLTQKYRRDYWVCKINFNLQTYIWPEYYQQNQTNQKRCSPSPKYNMYVCTSYRCR